MSSAAPLWATRGLRPWTLLIWLPLFYSLLIGPILDPTTKQHPVPAGLAVTAAALIFTGVVLTRYRRSTHGNRTSRLLLVALAVLAVATTWTLAPAWSVVFLLLAAAVGVVFVDRRGPVVVLVVTVLAGCTDLLAGSSVDHGLSTGLTTLVTGLGSYAMNQLFAVVAELRCTRQDLARMAVSQERDRFARDLHDLLGHTLSVIVVKAEAVRRLAPVDGTAAATHAADIESIGREALTEVRRAVSGYRGAGLDRELTRARAALDAAGVSLSLDRSSVRPLPADADVLLGWVVREGATNVVRHARARHCTIGIDAAEPDDGAVRLTIEDDGVGVQQSHGSTGGLIGLTERVAALGGTLAAGPAPAGTGFRLTVTVPATADPVPVAAPVRQWAWRGRSAAAEVTAP
jgi:two-component system, NarL family, sensor histidine kinase DesK